MAARRPGSGTYRLGATVDGHSPQPYLALLQANTFHSALLFRVYCSAFIVPRLLFRGGHVEHLAANPLDPSHVVREPTPPRQRVKRLLDGKGGVGVVIEPVNA